MTVRDLLQAIVDSEGVNLESDVCLGPGLKALDFVEIVRDPHPLIKPYVVLHTGDEN